MGNKKISFLIVGFFIFSIALPLHAKVIYSNNFDNEKVSCWNDINKDWRSVCGDFYEIGKGSSMQLSTLHSHSGSYAAVHRAQYNEERGQAYVNLANPMSHTNGYDELYVRVWNYFTGEDGTYDHAWQPKVMRIYSSNNSTAAFDIVVNLMDLDGDRDLENIKISFNRGPNDWGAANASFETPNNKWVCFELHIKLNTLGKSDGLVELYIDGGLKAKKSNVNIRGTYNYKMNRVLVGGWYSNGGVNSNQNNYRYIDDLVISTDFIGTGSSSNSSVSSNTGGSLPPPAPTSIRVEGSTP